MSAKKPQNSTSCRFGSSLWHVEILVYDIHQKTATLLYCQSEEHQTSPRSLLNFREIGRVGT